MPRGCTYSHQADLEDTVIQRFISACDIGWLLVCLARWINEYATNFSAHSEDRLCPLESYMVKSVISYLSILDVSRPSSFVNCPYRFQLVAVYKHRSNADFTPRTPYYISFHWVPGYRSKRRKHLDLLYDSSSVTGIDGVSSSMT